MRFVRGSHFWQFGSITSLATETTDGPKCATASEAILECLI